MSEVKFGNMDRLAQRDKRPGFRLGWTRHVKLVRLLNCVQSVLLRVMWLN